ncbi:NlpC/P60 family protein [Streptomyces sp. N2-109]|uniref:NlpC/P60 family protein n=1 Tax=Streptomyces gossypii TaxID=2883101 RepID=A0ABT2JV71_9ACTN|nr:C40 family peptidase [Streptomyces gossypii]MCT2591794.1 NlpC/P60 family protein [Streptomyces gossypii]
MSQLKSVRSATALTVATATAVVLAAQPALPAQPSLPALPAEPVLRLEPAEPAEQAEPAARAALADRPVSELLTELDTLYQRTEAAAEAYKSAGQKLATQRTKAEKLGRQLSRTRSSVDEGRDEAGRLARSQYRSGALVLPADAQLMLADDPARALANAHALERAVSRQARTVKRLTSAERREQALAARAQRAFDRQRRLADGRKAHRDRARARLRQVEKLLTSLPPSKLAQLRELEDTRTARSQDAFLAEGTLGGAAGAARTPTRQGARALSYALAQQGKPYAWGAEGPGSFDCSGLTARAWEQAGHSIPRTSQQQWRQLEQVPLHELRPGDLVVYFTRATHVGLYAGRGMIVHAPRPGAQVKVSPIAANPVLGAVRPDPESRPLPFYDPPPLPTGDERGGQGNQGGQGAGDDAGYDAAAPSG